MKTEVVENTYENGKRISMQKVTYDKSDDLFTLANLQRQYEGICRKIEEGSITDSAYLLAEKERLETEIQAQQAIIDQYE